MNIEELMEKGILIKRYNRFLAEIELANGKKIIAHCPNIGSMKQCKTGGSDVIVSLSANQKRKYPYTWQMVKVKDKWCCVNTIFANKLAGEAIKNGVIKELNGYNSIKAEQKYGSNSRIDFLLEKNDQMCYVEVKNVTLTDDDKTALFPDAVTARGQKHLRELINQAKAGNRAVMLYVVQRQEAEYFDAAREIDADYARLLDEAAAAGVEVLACRSWTEGGKEIYLKTALPWKKRI